MKFIRIPCATALPLIEQVGCCRLIRLQWPVWVAPQAELNRVSQAIVFRRRSFMRLMSSSDKSQYGIISRCESV
jgi:hypothetical protein